MRKISFTLFGLIFVAVAVSLISQDQAADAGLKKSFRRPEVNGWTFVHLEGTPSEIGYQHGYQLAPEILDMRKLAELELKHSSEKDWMFFRNAARDMMWPHIEQEYRDELEGISAGVNARGIKLDLWDIVALNGLLEWDYYVKEFNKQNSIPSPKGLGAAEHCSAFVATGSYTEDGKVIIAHNNWTSYMEGTRWTIVLISSPPRASGSSWMDCPASSAATMISASIPPAS